MSQFPAGWYNDPQVPNQERYFDGRTWTTQTRTDIPDIPLAPWVDRANPGLRTGYVVDTSAPRTSGSTWIAVVVGLAAVAALTTIGVTTTSAAIDDQLSGPVSDPQPPSNPGADPVLPVYTCAEVESETVAMGRDYGDLLISGFASPSTATIDNQPIYTLPSGSDIYLVLECVGEANFTDGHVGTVRMQLGVDSSSGLQLGYGEE